MDCLIKNFYDFRNFIKIVPNVLIIYIEIRAWECMSESERHSQAKPNNIYIIKPGEITNRGHGI